MTSVALYSEQPVLTAGLQAVMAEREDLTLAAVFTDIGPLIEYVRMHRASVVLVEVTDAISFTTLSSLKAIAGETPIVLWGNITSTEFVSQALALGIRGVLRKS